MPEGQVTETGNTETGGASEGAPGAGEGQGNSILNGGAAVAPEGGEGTQAQAGEGEQGGQGGQAAGAEGETTYELKLPEGNQHVNDDTVAAITEFAKEHGMSNEAAQALLDREAKGLNDLFTNLGNMAAEQMEQDVQQLRTDLGAKFDETVTLAQKGIDAVAPPEFRDLLDEHGLGNNPMFVQVFAEIGRAITEDGFILGGLSGGNKSPGEIMYPDANKTTQ